MAWRCIASPSGDDCSAAADLRLATQAYTYHAAARFLQFELAVGAAPAGPTPLYLNARAALDGTSCGRLAEPSRWMAMRCAMLRRGIADGTISPRKLPPAMNPADGLTKCLSGKPCMRYAMLRRGVACGTISPRKRLTAMNPTDGLTKCLTGKPFENGRARLLGLPIPHPGL